MNEQKKRGSIPLKSIRVIDRFWNEKMELIRKEVLPYQWDILNDRIPEAAPSFCIRNFQVASRMQERKRKEGDAFRAPSYTYRGFEVLPESMNNLKEEFYGFVFQDSDLYKWIEAVAYSLTAHPDAELERIADEAIALICAAQQDNGYLDTYYIIGGMDQIFTNLKDHHELYCMGHLIEGAVAYYEATGKDRLLGAAMRFADYADTVFGTEPGKLRGYPGHELAEMALLRLYELTGEEKYRNLAMFFLNERGKSPQYWMAEAGYKHGDEERYRYNQSHLPVREQQEAVGHAVRAMYLYCAMTDAARLTGDRSLHDACRNLWNSVVQQKLYITGGIGATADGEAFSFPYDLPNDLAYAETCASIGLVFWAWRMLRESPRSEYADIMENALYNTVLSGMALDGKSFFYVNPLEVLPEACRRDSRKSHVKSNRQKWFGCACCPPNLARTIASVGKYAFTEKERTFWVHLYIGAELCVGGGQIRIQSAFPWEGRVEIEVLEDLCEYDTIALRIPAWCEDFAVETSEPVQRSETDGYLYLNGRWRKGSRIQADFKMRVRAVSAHPLVRENTGKIALIRGPLVYCAEQVDNGENLHLLEVALPICAAEVHTELTAEGEISVDVHGRALPYTGGDHLYQFCKEQSDGEERIIRFVPYFLWNNRGEGEMQVWTRFFA